MSRRRTLSPAVLAAALALAPAAHALEDRAPEQALRELLSAPCPGWADVPPLQQRLVDLGPAALPELFRVHATGELVDTGAAEPLPLGRMRALAVAGALERLPRPALLGHLEGLADDCARRAERRAGLELLGRLASEDELALLFRLGAPCPTEPGAYFDELAPFEEALASLLVREPSAAAALAASLPRVPGPLVVPCVRAIGEQGTPEALAALVRAVHGSAPLDAALLVEIRELVAGGLWPARGDLPLLRRPLAFGDAPARKLAVLLAAELGDTGAVPELIALLEDGTVATEAHAALRSLARRKLPADLAAWDAWYRAESEWWSRRARTLLESVASGERAAACAAVRELALHPVFADELASGLGDALRTADPEAAVLACRAFAEARAGGLLPVFVDLLDHGSASVRAAAHDALRTVTGASAPANPNVWRRFVAHSGR